MKNIKKDKKFIIRRVLLIVVLILILFFVFFISYKCLDKDYYSSKSRISLSKNYKIEDAETLGWIQVQGTNIDYPVIDETNNAYTSGIDYLWQVNSYKSDYNREAIYGHNIRNVSSEPIINDPDHTRFEQLMGFVYKDFAEENLYITYTYGGKNHLYKIYAVGFVSTDEENGECYKDEELINSYIKKAVANSLYKYDIDVKSSDHLISLITCTRYFGLEGKTQFRVDAREVRNNEKIKKYSLKTTKNYDEINKK